MQRFHSTLEDYANSIVWSGCEKPSPRSEGDLLELNGKFDDIQEEHKNGCQSIQRSGQRKPLSHVRKLHDGENIKGYRV